MNASLLAELDIRHTRRHMPTRRVALDNNYLPTYGAASGLVLLRAVAAEFTPQLDDEQQGALPALLSAARHGLGVPRIALRYRLQTDVHGLDRSRHRLMVEHGCTLLELDVHGRPDPQVIGAVMAAAAMPQPQRSTALHAIGDVVRHGWSPPDGLVIRRLLHGLPGSRPAEPGVYRAGVAANGAGEDAWRGVPTELRWAMEVLGMRPTVEVARADVQRRFRRLLREAHPDHGATDAGAAERIAELSEARHVLLGTLAG